MKESDYDMLKTLMDSFKKECEFSYNEERADIFGQLHDVIHKFLSRKNRL
tara:strand:+ start:3169 stop:3318 length:150 start_codon:yes stop_codon:yes gene_type:complete